MGSATLQALQGAKASLGAVPAASRLQTGRELFAAEATIAESVALRGALADGAADPAAKAGIVNRVFASLGAPTRSVLTAAVGSRWSSQDDLVAGIEELAVRSVAASAPDASALTGEIAAFGAAVRSDAELEYAVGSALVPGATKSRVVAKLLAGKASEQAVEILTHLVATPRGRRIGDLVGETNAIVADEAGRSVATVETAAALSEQQLGRIRESLTRRAGRTVSIEQIIDPGLVGGVRIRLGDEVIDGTVSRRLSELRLALVG